MDSQIKQTLINNLIPLISCMFIIIFLIFIGWISVLVLGDNNPIEKEIEEIATEEIQVLK